MRLNDRMMESPLGWNWTVPETRWVAKGKSFADLVKIVRLHYSDNGFNYGLALEGHVEHGLCADLCDKRHYAYVRHPELPPEEFINPLKTPAGVEVRPISVPSIKKLLSKV